APVLRPLGVRLEHRRRGRAEPARDPRGEPPERAAAGARACAPDARRRPRPLPVAGVPRPPARERRVLAHGPVPDAVREPGARAVAPPQNTFIRPRIAW